MRVAYVCGDVGVPVFGTKGASVHVQEIVRAWRKTGATVTVYCTRAGTARPPDLADLKVVEVVPARAEGRERERAAKSAAINLAARIVCDGTDLLYERYSLFSPVLAVVVPLLAVPSVLEVNAPLIEEQLRYRGLWDIGGAEDMLRRSAESADVVACVSDPVVRWIRGRAPGANVILAPNGVNVDRITPRRPGWRRMDRLTIGFVGTLKPWHGVPILLDAVAQANFRTTDPTRRWAVRIIGDGPGRAELERRAEELAVKAEFTGAVPPEAIPELLGACDAAAAPYPGAQPGGDDYFSPLKIYEYMAAAMPIIATSTGQIPSILEHGRTGLVVTAGDAPAFASALLELAGDAALRERLGRHARADAASRFTWEGVLSRITAALSASPKVPVP
ncbi:glycosyltransferase family 4 protein [Pseudarthrobacter sp. P1]|uniref:glycosyltransferase family 4 protein n=1 Tax=Pseudarthrobacter sp. P1 TaxID=3418418 RepID=UPI003CE75521